MTGGERVAARARACVGVRFRPQGRDVAMGLDCVGLAAVAAGVKAVRSDYSLRGNHRGELERELRGLGFYLAEEAAMGDILLFDAGPAQVHLGVLTGEGVVHADAGLRKVVERPLPFAWSLLSIWRLMLAPLAPLHRTSCGPPPLPKQGRS